MASCDRNPRNRRFCFGLALGGALCFVLFHLSARGAPTPSTAPTTTIGTSQGVESAHPAETKKELGFGQQLLLVIAPAVAAAALAALAQMYRRLSAVRRKHDVAEAGRLVAVEARKEADQRRERLARGIVESVQIPAGDRRNSVLVLGLGGSGKSSLINAVLAIRATDPTKKTEAFKIYRNTFEQDPDPERRNGPRIWVYMSDYRGQNLGQVVANFALEQKRLFSPMIYGAVNSLVLIVDLRPPPPDETAPQPTPQALPDKSRIRRNLQQWNDTALEAILGLFTRDSLKYVCIFVNKIDLMTDRSEAADQSRREAYSDLVRRLADRVGPAEIDMVLGSAKGGEGVDHLRHNLFKHAVPYGHVTSRELFKEYIDGGLERTEQAGQGAAVVYGAAVSNPPGTGTVSGQTEE